MIRGLKLALRLGATAALLALVLRHAPLSELSGRLTARAAAALGVGLLIFLTSQGVAAFRWRTVLGSGAPRWLYLYRLYLVGGFFNVFLPTSVGGDAVRGATLAKATGRPAEAFSSLIADRMLGVSALVMYAVIGVAAVPQLAMGISSATRWRLSQSQLVGGIVVLGLLCLLAVRLLPRWPAGQRAALEAMRVFTRLARSPARLTMALSLGLISQGLLVGLWALLAWSAGLSLPIGLLLLAVPVASLAGLLPVSIGGLGVRDGAWLVLLSAAGYEAGSAVASSLLYFVVTVLAGAVGGLAFISLGVTLKVGDQ